MPKDDAAISPRLRRRLTVTLVLFALYTIGRFGIDQIRPPGLIPNDYMNFHRAAERLSRGAEIYVPTDDSPFKYSPTFLVAFRATFGQLPPSWAWGIWCTLSIFGFVWATRWLWAATLGRLSGGRLALLIGAFGLFAWHGYLEHFSYGQGDMFLFAAFVAAVAAGSDLGAALLMSALLVMKPQSAILLAYFLIGRRWRMLGLTALGTLGALLLPALGWGWSRQAELFSHWKVVLGSQNVEFMTGNLNQSVAATLARLSGRRELTLLLTPLFVGIGGLAALGLALLNPLPREAKPAGRARAALGVLLLYALICPLSWRWSTFVWLPIGVVLAADALRSHARGALRARVFLAAFALNALVLQTVVAHLLGVAEVDSLSRVGLYTLGNLLLAAAYLSERGLSRLYPVAGSRAP